jgi:hypothetical protein
MKTDRCLDRTGALSGLTITERREERGKGFLLNALGSQVGAKHCSLVGAPSVMHHSSRPC